MQPSSPTVAAPVTYGCSLLYLRLQLSMIYGLGGYDGGAICVEGTATDIRYAPLEFDG